MCSANLSVQLNGDQKRQGQLLPVGTVGELLVEGPILARGYLNDEEKTAAAFIEDPDWLLAGVGGRPGRRGRLYKTGDLVRYNPDGTLTCSGYLYIHVPSGVLN